MLIYFVTGMVLGLVTAFDDTEEPTLSIFTRLCKILLTLQVLMTLTLLLGLYTIETQWLILSVPWTFGVQALYSKSLLTLRKNISTNVVQAPSLWTIPLLLTLCAYLWHASPPPWMRDSLTYHLALAKQYAIHGHYVDTDFVVFSHFPQGWQSLLTLFHTADSGTALCNPRYLAVFITIATGLGIFGWLKRKTESVQWAMTGSMLYLLTPSVIEFGTSCYVQPWLTALCFYLILSIDRKESAWWVGLLAGAAISVKYSALILPFMVAPLMYTQRNSRELVQFLGGVAVLGGAFLLRNAVLTGNPVFPLMYEWFGGNHWDLWRAVAYESTLENYGMGREALDYLLLPFRLFTTQNMHQYFQGSLGVGWLLLLIAHGFLRNKEDLSSKHTLSPRWMWGLLGVWFVFWTVQVQQIRFLLPFLPLIALLCIPVVSVWKPKSWGLWLLLSGVWSIKPLQSLLYNQQGHVYWEHIDTSTDAKWVFLEHRLPENMPLYRHLNALKTTESNSVSKVWLVWMRGYHYYLEHPVRLDNVFGATRFERLLHEHDAVQVAQKLKQDHISHIAIHWRFFLVDQNADYLGENATVQIQARFNELIQNQILLPQKQWGPVWLYEVADSELSSPDSLSSESPKPSSP